jgi:hypothetical protein
MTTKEKAIRLIETLPEDATLGEIVEQLQHLDTETAVQLPAEQESHLREGGAWDLLENSAGTVEMPADWASEHDHYLYGTPKRSSAA